jgi:hypothetical protein
MVARGAAAAIHVPPDLLQAALAEGSILPSAVLLRADLRSDRPLVALTVRDLIERGIPARVLKHRLTWVAERRALFGILPLGSPGGLPQRMARCLTEGTR